MANEQSPLIAVVSIQPQRPRYRHSTLRRFCTIVLFVSLIVAVFCFLLPITLAPSLGGPTSSHLPWVGHFHDGESPNGMGMRYEDLQSLLLKTPSEAKARKWSQYYTAGPHLAGRNLSQAVWTRERWEEFGIQSTIVPYDVYLNYPLRHRLALLDVEEEKSSSGSNRQGAIYKTRYECSLEEDALDEDETTRLSDRVPTFHGYSASGNVTAAYVYVNFGTYRDFGDLIAANVSLEGKIAIAKYGHVFRGLKVKRAQELGMVGMVMYTDPQEDGNMTLANGYKAYPDGPARNPSSVQRGSTQFISVLPGDPTTPGIPSKPDSPRVDPHGSIPSIPSIPISYRDAIPLLKGLNGYGPSALDFNQYWLGGGLTDEGVEYNIGPSPDTLMLNLMNEQQYETTPIWNVIGVINGTIPDEAIVLGNHRDAWVAGGAGDPNAGSAALNEVIRSFGLALKDGWKPLRTIVFASWDGEEYGLLGSTEWVEEYIPWLSAACVAYLNVDVGTVGPDFHVAASPLLNGVLLDAVAKVPSPNQTIKGQTVRDTWDGRIHTMGSGSDFTAFQDYAGIPSIDMGFQAAADSPIYHYHSNYDSFHWMEKFGDTTWKYHVTIARIWALVAASLSENRVLNLNATDYAVALSSYIEDVKEKPTDSPIPHIGSPFSFKPLDDATRSFHDAAAKFDKYAADLTRKLSRSLPWWQWWKKAKTLYQVRKVNNTYKLLERKFLYADGLDDRSWFKHVVFAPGRWTGYSGATFPGLVESFEDGNVTNAEKWSDIIVGRLHDAASSLTG